MAGQKITITKTFMSEFGREGFPLVTIIENGNVKADDEWALFRMTEEGANWYAEGYEFAAGIMTMVIDGKPAVEGEISRFKTQDLCIRARSKLPMDEQRKTLVRSVPPR